MVNNRCNIFCVIIYSIITYILYIKFNDLNIKHLLLPIISCALTILGSTFYKDLKKYYQCIFLFMTICVSIFIIIFSVKLVNPIEGKECLTWIAFSGCIIQLIMLTINLLKNMWGGYTFGIDILLILGSSIPILICWGYYVAANSWISVESCMAILQTNPMEAQNYISDHTSLTNIFIVSIIFVVIILLVKVVKEEKLTRYKRTSIVMIFFLLNMSLLYRCRENLVTNIVYDTWIYSNTYNEYLQARKERQENLKQLEGVTNSGEDGVYVLIIGESATRDHMACYGYSRNTTPWFSSMKNNKNFVQFNNAWSCANDTVSALTYALTAKNQYNSVELKKAVSIIEAANAAGYDTVWLSNQVQYGLADTPITSIAADSKQQVWIRDKVGHLKDGRYLDLPDYYDEKILPAIDSIHFTKKMLIVIHLMGSHNSYKLRYPASYAIFNDSRDKSYIDYYDNSILYTDSVLKNIFQKLSNIDNLKSIVYFSDHGEGIDKNLQHDSNNYIPQMTRIPFAVYLSKSFENEQHETYDKIKKSNNRYFTNDLIFNTMLGLMDIKLKKFEEKNNIIWSKEYDNSKERFRTSYGRREISEE